MVTKLVLAAGLALASLPFFWGDGFLYHVAILIGIEALLALSLHLTLRIGQLSLAQAAFMGMGAYASALLTRDAGLPFPAAFLAAIAIPALIAAALGTVILKVRGVHFALLTFMLGQAVVLIFVEMVFPFGGNNGLMRIPAIEVGGFGFQSRPAFYGLTLAVLAAAVLLVSRLVRGETGDILDGLALNEALTQSLGIDALAWRRLVFALSGGIAGAAGSLYAHYLGYISPEAFGVAATINALIMNVIGGVGLLAGPIVGAIVLVPLPEFFRSALLYQQLFYGLSLLALMLFLPRGLLGLLPSRRRA
jgi:branched-chain amino acid transport system permease protein